MRGRIKLGLRGKHNRVNRSGEPPVDSGYWFKLVNKKTEGFALLRNLEKMPINYIKVFGERNSGTNYLSSLLAMNVKNIELLGGKYGWKHGFVNHEVLKGANDTLFLVIFKDPYSWAVSMRGKPHHAPQLHKLPFSEFIRSEWACYTGDNFDKRNLATNPVKPEEEMMNERNPNTKKRFGNVMLMRQAKIRSYLRIGEFTDKFEVVRYEDLLYTPKQVLNKLIRKYELPRTYDRLKLDQGYHGKNPNKPFTRRRYYLQKEYFDKYTPEDLTYINEFINFELEGKLGYIKEASLPIRQEEEKKK